MFTPSSTFVDLVINHPSVRPTVQQGVERLSSYELVSNRANEVVADEDGLVMLFLYQGNGVYEGHVFAVDGSRGRKALQFGKQAITRLFDRPGARVLVAAAPLVLPAVATYCRRLGLKPDGRDLFHKYFKTEAVEWAAS